MKIDEKLLRKYLFHNQVIIEHIRGVAESYIESAYDNEEELESDMNYALKRTNKLIEIERELLAEIEKQSSDLED